MQRYRRQQEINFSRDYSIGKGVASPQAYLPKEQVQIEVGKPVEYKVPESLDHINEILWYIASHYEKFDFDFKNEDVSEAEQAQRRSVVVEALEVVLGENIDASLKERYVKAILSQLKKGVVVDPPTARRRHVSGAVLRGARGNALRAKYRVGK